MGSEERFTMILTQEKFEKIINNFQALKPILVVGDLGVDKYTFGEVNFT
jgi:D-glycero-beta-D-manno-heptose-7-phosphate kinase